MSVPPGPGASPNAMPTSGMPAGGPVPLLFSDPPRVDDFWLDARLVAGPSGVTFLAHDSENNPVMVVMLTAGAAGDAAARDRLAGEVNKLHVDTVVARGGQGQDGGRLADKFRSTADDPDGPDDSPLAPWVALAFDGSPAAIAEAQRLLDQVDLSRTRPLGSPTGPDYRLYWTDNTAPGTSRLWPLPWPGRYDRAGWITLAASWLAMVLLTATALLVWVLLFQNSPPTPPPPPVSQTPPPSETPPPPSSGDPSSGDPSSGDPSSAEPSSADPSNSASGNSASQSPSNSGSGDPASQTPSGSGSNSGSPSSASASSTGSGSPSQSPTSSGPSESGGEGSPTQSASMNSPDGSGTQSAGGGSPSPNSRL